MNRLKTVAIHLGLFIVTFVVTTISGVEWSKPFSIMTTPPEEFWAWDSLRLGLMYSCSFLGILTIHEFGHYLFARYYKVDVSLPYYIPMWLGFLTPILGAIPSIGSLGAFIRIKSPLQSRSQFFDVGVAGPLAGFVATLCVLIYGFTNLPEPSYIYEVHPEYETVWNEKGFWDDSVYSYDFRVEQHVQYQLDLDTTNTKTRDSVYIPTPDQMTSFGIGNNLLMTIMGKLLVDDEIKIPNGSELMHYPFLFAGYLACFFTALNLLPIGQLDGGHVIYGLIGPKWFNKISPFLFKGFVFYAGLGVISPHIFNTGLTNNDVIYVVLLFFMFAKMYPDIKKRLFYIFIILALQFITVFLIPDAYGYPGYMVFGLVVGRVLGVTHPPAINETKMNPTRMIIGIVAIVVFILCFSPVPFIE